ncbi:hypothetical protein [Methanobrevibacter sp.]|uniref:hypothetical protein n=1 Tax=Methanobrevibacter sp. TaxID=66852 RepID=UPI0038901859
MIRFIDARLDTLKKQLEDRIKSYNNYLGEIHTANYEINAVPQLIAIQDLKSRIDELTKLKEIAKTFE